MLFPTVEFAIFFPIVLALSWALMSRQPLWKPFIVVASYVFYAAADPRFCLLLAAITLVSQLAVVAIHRTEDERLRKWFTAGGVVFDLGILAVFKYYGFFVTDVSRRARHGRPGDAAAAGDDRAARSGSASSASRRSPTWST